MKRIFASILVFFMLICGNCPAVAIWQDMTDGLTDEEFYSIAEGPGASGENIYIGTSGGLYKSEQNTKSWKQIFICRGEYKGIKHIYVDQDNIIYIATKNGLYRSHNFGKDWKRLFRGIGKENYLTDITFDNEDKDTIYLGTLEGLFWTEDRGKTWKRFRGVLGNSRINSITITKIPSDHQAILLAFFPGLREPVLFGAKNLLNFRN